MAKTVEDSRVMSFIEIGETYADEYILVKIVEIDHDKGVETGIPVCVSSDLDELYEVEKSIIGISMIILPGDELIPGLGGLL